MKYAIISDIHSNLEALRACLEVIDREGVDVIACLGDIVGYGASPNECLALVRERAHHVVIGNHDGAAIGTPDTDYFNHDARSAVLWTRGSLDPEHVAYLRGLPYTLALGDVLLVHASPAAPPEWRYIFHVREARAELAAFRERVCFIGHSHFPTFFVERGGGEAVQQSPPSLVLRPGERAMVNVGSVGQPRDGDPRASFAFYDEASGRVEIRRVFYDVERVRGRILETSLPRSAAERLVWGV
jgi:diadenosine tetraphosphatase ApaH/serine/threonine PP2A family protein phosphatase